MSPVSIAFLALFIPGLVMIALVVAIALPRAVRDEREQQQRQRGEGDD
jgi:TRAP-type C4-dicarboxylate transport system permease large subunit